jgi:ribulose-5-phosphate 4-epimerase/fuculose-1-phosphate aldolase
MYKIDPASLLNMKNKIIATAKLAYKKGLTSAAGGNLSVRIPGTEYMLIKATGRPFRSLRPEDIVVIDFNGKLIEGSKEPSKEWRFHVGIYRTRPELNAVIHTHSPYATTYAVLGVEIPLITEARNTLVRVPIVEEAPPGSERLALAVTNAFADNKVRAVILKNHGVVAAGRNLEEALNIAELVEDVAKIAYNYELLRAIQSISKTACYGK